MDVAINNGSDFHATANPFIVVRVTENENCFPVYSIYKKGKGYIDHLLLSREKLLFMSPHTNLDNYGKRKYQKDIESGAQEDNTLIEMQMHTLLKKLDNGGADR